MCYVCRPQRPLDGSAPTRELWDWDSGGQACVKLSAAEPSHWLLTPPLYVACVTSTCADVSVPPWRLRQSPCLLEEQKATPDTALEPCGLDFIPSRFDFG